MSNKNSASIIIAGGLALAGILGWRYLVSAQTTKLALSEPSISPVAPVQGNTVILSVKATNTGTSRLTYTLKLTGDATGSKSVALDAGASTTVTFTYTVSKVGTNTVRIDGFQMMYQVTAGDGANIVLSGLSVRPTSLAPGETLTMSVNATNSGGQATAVTVIFSVN